MGVKLQDKVALLMEETGCDRGEAELALEMCGFELEKAVRAIPRLLKNIVVLRGKFQLAEHNQFGLILVILNSKTRTLLRARAVLSYNPAVYSISFGSDWFEFEKHLFACRLRDGSLQAESQEIEVRLGHHFRSNPASDLFSPVETEGAEDASREIGAVLKSILRDAAVSLSVKKEILDLGQFQSLRGGESEPAPSQKTAGASWTADEPLILKVSLEEDAAGIPAGDIRSGDTVYASINDGRDIAVYLWKLFGGYSPAGLLPLSVPVEAVESVADAAPGGAPSGWLVRVRFAAGVCGDASLKGDKNLKVSRVPEEGRELPWWRRLFAKS